METKIKDITGAEITVTDLKEAVRQCRECLASPYLMPSGHTVGKTMPTCCGNCSPCKGGNGNTAGNGRENTTRKKSDDMKCTPNIGRISICLDGMSSVLYRAHVV